MVSMEEVKAKALKSLSYDPEAGVFTWVDSGRRAGGENSRGYRRVSVCNVSIKEHRLAFVFMTGDFPTAEVDHINGIRSDNRWANLRTATRSEQLQNAKFSKPSGSPTKYTGVFRRDRKWAARIHLNGRMYWLGTFESDADAAAAYLTAKAIYHPFQPIPR